MSKKKSTLFELFNFVMNNSSILVRTFGAVMFSLLCFIFVFLPARGAVKSFASIDDYNMRFILLGIIVFPVIIFIIALILELRKNMHR